MSKNLHLGDFYFKGYKTKKGAFGVIAEVILQAVSNKECEKKIALYLLKSPT
jgi:hypothetical protein